MVAGLLVKGGLGLDAVEAVERSASDKFSVIPCPRSLRASERLQICGELHIERLSSVRRKRPGYDNVIAQLSPRDLAGPLGSGACLVFIAGRFERQIRCQQPERCACLFSIKRCAEFERRMLGQRTREGIAAARQRGVRLGRPPKLNENQLIEANQLLTNPETTIASVARDLGVAPWSLTRSMKRLARRVEPLDSP